MKSSTALVLLSAFCAFAFAPCASATGEGRREGSNWTENLPPLLAPRRVMLERVYADVGPGGGYAPGSVAVVGKSVGHTLVDIRVTAPNAKNYVAKCFQNSPKKNVAVKVSLRTGTTPPQAVLSLAGLTPSKSYTCDVYATSGGKRGPVANIPFRTLNADTPAAPKLKSVATKRSSATIVTTRAEGATGHRALCYAPSKPAVLYRTAINAKATELLVSVVNLAPETQYVCDISGSNASGNGRVLKVAFTTKK